MKRLLAALAAAALATLSPPAVRSAAASATLDAAFGRQ